ncbi:MAG: endonuclease III [Phycisphaeraceae bacterium]|nr:endonuclease III [Phycisphaeraceae bacterium]
MSGPHAPAQREHGPLPFALPRVTATQRRRAAALLAALEAHYPDAHCELEYRKPHELLVATILSAQATDVGVNKATPALFAAFPTPADYAASSPEQIEAYIRSIGLFRNKARAIHTAMKDIAEKFGGRVPRTMDELLTLRGVARKTANVVLGNAFGINVGFVVDTHVERLAKRFGLAPADATVAMTERWLMALFPRDRWCDVSHMLIWHGRRACKARLPACADHPVCRGFGSTCELRISARASDTDRTKSNQKPGSASRAAKRR